MKIESGIKSIRQYKGFTQKELANILGVTSVTIQNYENARRNPSVEMLISIAEALDVELSVILDGFSKEIFITSDVLYAWEKLNKNLKISSFLSANNQPFSSFLLFNEPDNLNICYLISKKLKLSECEVSNWVKSIAIKKYIKSNDDIKQFLSDELLKDIVKQNILIDQNNSTLFESGLSIENQSLIKDFLLEPKINTQSSIKNIPVKKYILEDGREMIDFSQKRKTTWEEAILGTINIIDYVIWEDKDNILENCYLETDDYKKILEKLTPIIENYIYSKMLKQKREIISTREELKKEIPILKFDDEDKNNKNK